MTFEEFWQKGIDLLRTKISDPGGNKIVIDNWRADRGLSGQRFPLVKASDGGIKCLSIHASKEINIPKEDMEVLYGMWGDYLSGEVNRMDIIDSIPRPAYCLSLMKYLKDNVS